MPSSRSTHSAAHDKRSAPCGGEWGRVRSKGASRRRGRDAPRLREEGLPLVGDALRSRRTPTISGGSAPGLARAAPRAGRASRTSGREARISAGASRASSRASLPSGTAAVGGRWRVSRCGQSRGRYSCSVSPFAERSSCSSWSGSPSRHSLCRKGERGAGRARGLSARSESGSAFAHGASLFE